VLAENTFDKSSMDLTEFQLGFCRLASIMAAPIHGGLVSMTDSLDELQKKIPLLSAEEKDQLRAQVQRLIGLIMRDVRSSAQHLEGRSSRYREAWSLITERRGMMLSDLERITAMLD
jgi:hypothetical protein